MTTITKERLRQVIDGDILFTDEQRDLARMLLASMDSAQEPVYQYRIRNSYNGQVTEWQTIRRDQVDFVLKAQPHNAEFQIIATPQPLADSERAELTAKLEAAQRHIAELEAAPPAPVGPGEEAVAVMPDFPGRVMAQRECYRAGWDAHHAASLRAGAPVQFGWSKGHFGYNTLFNAIIKSAKIQGNALSISVNAFEDAMFTAAPQPVPVEIDERAAFNAWNNDENLPVAGVGAKNAAWLAWQARAALLQPGLPVITDSENLITDNAGINSTVIPDGWVMVPVSLTAENGAKAFLLGEFSESTSISCPECFGADECETCDGSGSIKIELPVSWTTIKGIWAKGIEHFAAAPQQEVKEKPKK